MIKKVYLIVRADQSVRMTKGRITLTPDEVCIPVNIKFPDNWGRALSEINITLPDVPIEATVGDVETDEDDDYPMSIDAMHVRHPVENHPMEYPPGENP